MRHLTVTIAVALMSSPMLAGTAAGNSDPLPGVCRFLEGRVDQCASGVRLSLETRASCDRIEQGLRDLCGLLETVLASDSADSAALDLLRQDYEIVPIEDAVFPHNHVVVGPADLDDPEVADLLRAAHRAGKTVAITDATEDQVQSFHRLVRGAEEADCATPADPSRTIELYGLQQSANPSRAGSYCLRGPDHRNPASDRRWLRERFGAQVPGQVTPVPLLNASASRAGLATDPTVVLSQLVREWLGGRPAQAQTNGSSEQLTNLATGKTCSYKNTDDSVGSSSWDVQVWGMRSFSSPATDYYLVNFNPTLTPSVTGITRYVVNSLTLMEVHGSTSDNIETSHGFIIDTDPATETSFVSEYTNGSSTTVDGSVGFRGAEPEVEAGGEVEVSNETTTTVPPVTILNESDTITLEPSWTFVPQSTVAGADYEPMTAWVWQLPQATYPLGGTGTNQISFTPGANLFTSTANSTFVSLCNVTVPFPTWTVSAPVLTQLVPASATAGTNVTVDGQYMYPSAITAVLLGGTPVPTANLIFSESSTAFTLVVPSGTAAGSNDVQVETTVSGFGTQVSNTLTLDVTD